MTVIDSLNKHLCRHKTYVTERKSSFCLAQNVSYLHNMGTLKSVCSSWFALISRDKYEHTLLTEGPHVNKSLDWHKQFGPAQNFLGPVKGQGTRLYIH